MASVTDRARLIDVLLRAGANLGRDDAGRLVSAKVPPELVATVAELATDLELAVLGHRKVAVSDSSPVGHVWRRCNACGQQAVGEHTSGGDRQCNLTPGCKGGMLRLTDPEPIVLEDRPVACERSGCDRPAVILTAGHEPVCRSDFVHLAAHLHHHGRTP